MKSEYERLILIISEFDTEDIITTSSVAPSSTDPDASSDMDNRFATYNMAHSPGSWFS